MQAVPASPDGHRTISGSDDITEAVVPGSEERFVQVQTLAQIRGVSSQRMYPWMSEYPRNVFNWSKRLP